MTRREIDIGNRLPESAAGAGNVVNSLPNNRLGRHVAGQLIRSSTSPYANYEEACGAESRSDFVHKLGICLKELRETRAWLRLIARSKLLAESRLEPLLKECDELCRILATSIITAKRNRTTSSRSAKNR